MHDGLANIAIGTVLLIVIGICIPLYAFLNIIVIRTSNQVIMDRYTSRVDDLAESTFSYNDKEITGQALSALTYELVMNDMCVLIVLPNQEPLEFGGQFEYPMLDYSMEFETLSLPEHPRRAIKVVNNATDKLELRTSLGDISKHTLPSGASPAMEALFKAFSWNESAYMLEGGANNRLNEEYMMYMSNSKVPSKYYIKQNAIFRVNKVIDSNNSLTGIVAIGR